MFEPKMIKTAFFAAVLTVGAASANASTITFYDDVVTPSGEVATITCSDACSGLIEVPDTWSSDRAALFALDNSSEAGELAWVNEATGSDFDTSDKSEDLGVSSLSFDSDAEYILVKLGRDTGLIRNDSDGEQNYEFLQTGGGSGLSHYTEFGFRDVPQIPLPAAGFLLLGALGGLGAVARRRNK